MFLRKYGTATHVYIPIIKRGVVDFAVSADWTPAAGDVKISKDGGAAANVTNLPTAITMGNAAMWDFSLTATELQAAKVSVVVSDSATKAVEDTQFNLLTYGNASAELSGIDFTDAVRLGLTALPNATAGANGGLPLGDANARVDVGRWLGTAPNALVSGKMDATLAVRGGTAQAGATGSITLDAGATATDHLYRGLKVAIVSGTGAGQQRLITGYTGSSKVATVAPNWVTNPDATSVFILAGHCGVDVEQVALTAQTARDLGNQLDAQVSTRLSSASYTAPDNASIGSILTNTDVKTSTRLATSGYTAPDNASIGSILGQTDVKTSTRLATSGYTAPDNTTIGSIATALAALAGKFTGITLLASWLRLLIRSGSTDGTALTEINTGGTGAYAPATESIEYIANNLGGSGGSDPLTNLVPGSYGAGTAGAALGRIGTGTINVVSPLSASGDLTLIAGDDYLSADGRAIEFANTAGTWPNLTGATIFLIAIRNGSTLIEVLGSVVTPTGSQLVKVEPTADDLATPANAAASWEYTYGVYATLSNGHKVTLQTGRLTLTRAH